MGEIFGKTNVIPHVVRSTLLWRLVLVGPSGEIGGVTLENEKILVFVYFHIFKFTNKWCEALSSGVWVGLSRRGETGGVTSIVDKKLVFQIL